MRDPDALRATAYHEAGHAVAEVVQGLSVSSASIVADADDDSLGRCYSPPVLGYEFNSAREQRQVARASIVGCYAGVEAQRLVDPAPADFHGQADDEQAFAVSREYAVLPRSCEFVGDDAHMAYLERLRREARRLVRKHRRAVEAVAEALLQHETLDGVDIEAIVESVEGPDTKDTKGVQ